MTDLDLAKIKEAAEKATPGPWKTWAGAVVKECTKQGIGYPSDLDSIASLNDGEYIENPNSEADAEFIALARTAVPALIARLEAAEANLKWEQHRAGRIGTHSEDCHTWGPQHYECLLRKFNEAEARIATAYAEGVEEAAKVAENYSLMRHIAQDQHTGTFPNSSPVHTYLAQDIRSLLKDKPNG